MHHQSRKEVRIQTKTQYKVRRKKKPGNEKDTRKMAGRELILRQLSGEREWSSQSNGCGVMRKRVMVLVDESSYSKHAMMWALTHVANKADILTLLHVIPPPYSPSASSLTENLASLCKACRPEVQVEALFVPGPKMASILSQVKKLEVSVLVMGQKRSSGFHQCLCLKSSSEKFVQQCINSLECLTIGVCKQSRGVGGYLISTRWHKNFWLLA